MIEFPITSAAKASPESEKCKKGLVRLPGEFYLAGDAQGGRLQYQVHEPGSENTYRNAAHEHTCASDHRKLITGKSLHQSGESPAYDKMNQVKAI